MSWNRYLSAAETKYTAESKVADLMTLQQFLRDRIAIETDLVSSFGSADAPYVEPKQSSRDERAKARDALLKSIIERESVVKKIKKIFLEENSKLPETDRFNFPSGEEIRQKIRERNGAPAALAAGVAVPNPETWHARKGALQQLIEKRQKLLAKMDEARVRLLQMRLERPECVALDDATVSLVSREVSPSTDLTPENFDMYVVSLQHAVYNHRTSVFDYFRTHHWAGFAPT
jgi:hypothetical protein